jgi:MoaA/NifB/PqqE/SkfB family radical SAM enzyme
MYKIKGVQIDVNGLCNAGCWFCPVRYEGNPKSAITDMPLDKLENILKQLSDGKGDFVDNNLNLIYTANYNEVILYKHFEEMFDLYRRYGFKINLLTNGISFSKNKIDIVKDNIDVIEGILFNIPSADKQKWARYVNKNEKLFDRVLNNLQYASDVFYDLTVKDKMFLLVNGVNEDSLTKNGGWLDILENAPQLNLDNKNGDLQSEVDNFKKMFPKLNVVSANHLYDRAGHLAKFGILDQAPAINKYLKPKGTKVVGCNGGIKHRSRTNEWIHISPNGHFFICCADYDFETVFGDIEKNSIKEIWVSQDRQNMIQKSYENMCTMCSAAIWG